MNYFHGEDIKEAGIYLMLEYNGATNLFIGSNTIEILNQESALLIKCIDDRLRSPAEITFDNYLFYGPMPKINDDIRQSFKDKYIIRDIIE